MVRTRGCKQAAPKSNSNNNHSSHMREGGTQIPPLPVEFGQTPSELFPLIFLRNIQERWEGEDGQNREASIEAPGADFPSPCFNAERPKGEIKAPAFKKDF